MSKTNERYTVEFYDKKGNMDFACGLVRIDDVITQFSRDPARKAMVFDLEKGSYRSPVAVFEKLPYQKKWTKTFGRNR